MKEYVAFAMEIVYFEEETVRTSGIPLPDDEIGTDVGEF